MSFKAGKINADRICEAISQIGYNPSAAILDLVDNSVDAKAETIKIRLHIKEGMSVNNRQNVHKIQILDGGHGMSVDSIEKALDLGSAVEYENNSLSKYGLGLKSAGFSLGRRVEVVSKLSGQNHSKMFFLDRDVIRDNGFGYCIEDVAQSDSELISSLDSGTLVSIENIVYTSRVSAKKIMADIVSRAGVIYFEYLNANEVAFTVEIVDSTGEVIKTKSVEPHDILFWDDSLESFEKESYNGKQPCKVLDTDFENPLNPEGAKVVVKASIFPKNQMKTFNGFTEEEKANIKKYDVTLKNSGFYFYRNGRLIKWGEKLFLGREFGFRAIISFNTEHDELFDVDVSKQHLTVSEEVENILHTLTNIPRSQAKELFKICDRMMKDSVVSGNEGQEFNLKNSTLEEDEVEEEGVDRRKVLERKELLVQKSTQIEPEVSPKYEDEQEEEGFRRVRYWSNGRNIWESATDRQEGTYVLINKLHPYYDLVLSKLENNSPERQAIEALFHALAVGENQTVQKFQTQESDVVLAIFEKFSRASAHQLDSWVNNNWDLFDTED